MRIAMGGVYSGSTFEVRCREYVTDGRNRNAMAKLAREWSGCVQSGDSSGLPLILPSWNEWLPLTADRGARNDWHVRPQTKCDPSRCLSMFTLISISIRPHITTRRRAYDCCHREDRRTRPELYWLQCRQPSLITFSGQRVLTNDPKRIVESFWRQCALRVVI